MVVVVVVVAVLGDGVGRDKRNQEMENGGTAGSRKKEGEGEGLEEAGRQAGSALYTLVRSLQCVEGRKEFSKQSKPSKYRTQ